MQMRASPILCVLAVLLTCYADTDALGKKHHGHHHHHAHQQHHDHNATATKKIAGAAVAPTEQKIVDKMKALESTLASKEEAVKIVIQKGHIEVNGPLPVDFAERFAQAVGKATGADPYAVKVVESNPVSAGVVEIVFEAPSDIVRDVEDQVADPYSHLATGPLRAFLVADDDASPLSLSATRSTSGQQAVEPATPVQEKGIDVDTEMPYGELEPFGREDTAQELTESSIKESDEMVDQLERAEVAEEKRSVFRALTRLRGAAITSFDGVARAQTGNIDEYNKVHKWRKTHPLHHLADEESDISKWAFPDNADF